MSCPNDGASPQYNVTFEPPEEIEAARLAGPTAGRGFLLYTRVSFPALRKPVEPEPKRLSRFWRFLKSFSCVARRSDSPVPCDDLAFFPQSWSLLYKSKSNNFPFDEWMPVPIEQKPTNGDVWMRISRNRICLMLIISEAGMGYVTEPSSCLIAQTEDGPTSHFANTRYYYWDSGKLYKTFDIPRCRIMVAEGNICLLLVPVEPGGWSDEDLVLIQTSAGRLITSCGRSDNEDPQKDEEPLDEDNKEEACHSPERGDVG